MDMINESEWLAEADCRHCQETIVLDQGGLWWHAEGYSHEYDHLPRPGVAVTRAWEAGAQQLVVPA
jgi:hypothetical protein